MLHFNTLSDTHTHTRQDSSKRGAGPSQSPLPVKTQISHETIPPVGFEPAIPASERPQTYTLDRTATYYVITLTVCHSIPSSITNIC
jgi:hypothetical protein